MGHGGPNRLANHRKGITVRKTVLATAVAAALTLSAAEASAQTKGTATKAEVQSIQAQMQALSERLNRLETTNAELKTQNSELQALADRREAEMEYLKSQTKELREEGAMAANEISKVKGADWATKIKGRGDFRFRQESIWTERVRQRRWPKMPPTVIASASARAWASTSRPPTTSRARCCLPPAATTRVRPTRRWAAAVRASRSASTWPTSTGSSWRAATCCSASSVNPIFRPGHSLFYDGDYNPEGGAVKFDRGMFFGSAYGWWVIGELQRESGRREHRLGHLRPAGRHEVPAVRRRDGHRGQLLRVRLVPGPSRRCSTTSRNGNTTSLGLARPTG